MIVFEGCVNLLCLIKAISLTKRPNFHKIPLKRNDICKDFAVLCLKKGKKTDKRGFLRV